MNAGMKADPAIAPSCLYMGRVVHTRIQPVVHRLEYRVFSLLLDIDGLDGLGRNSRVFGYNRWRPVAFFDKDHGPRDGSPLRPWIDGQLSAHGIDPDGPVRLLCFPRLWGYVFNPLSVYYCYWPDGRLKAVLYEVSNTFGEWHGYLLPVEADGRADGDAPVDQQADKVFHVSPFNRVTGGYRFRLIPPEERMALTIRETDETGGDILHATHTARRAEFSDRALAAAVLRHPLMTAKVTAAIHWEALKLWRKGVQFHSKPEPPSEVVSGPKSVSG